MRLYEIRRQRKRRRQRIVILAISAFLTTGLTFLLATRAETQYEAPGEPTELSCEPVMLAPVTIAPTLAETEATSRAESSEAVYSKNWDLEESYLLAKIAMAEAEGESAEGKALVIMVVLNRVRSDAFPDTIREVIYQKNQFTPIASGRFDSVEPNADCWAAVQSVIAAQCDYSKGALYFESCGNADNWHSRNLEFLYQVGNHKFYK